MAKIEKGVTYVLALHMQAVGLFFVAWYAGKYLNTEYPKDFNWLKVTFAVALVSVFHLFYVIVRRIILDGKQDKTNKQ